MSSDTDPNPYLPPASGSSPPGLPGGFPGQPRELRIKDPRAWGWAAISFISLNCLTLTLRMVEVGHPGWLIFIALSILTTLLGAMVTYLVWIYRVASNTKIINPHSSTSPGWAVGSHFVPVANWVLPAMMVKEIADGTFRPRPPKYTGYVIAVWWVSLMLHNIAMTYQSDSAFIPVLGWAAGIGAAWLIIRISARQWELRESGLPVAPRPVMLATGGPRPVSATRLPQPTRPEGAPLHRPGPPSPNRPTPAAPEKEV
ncbi:DUF4328 domain-containing protein [Luteolibacter flavescens]|uniref:DUF4328 domain-containing protein n=1 Tax=Luteolibacter flavescens TaxID=1859460 RepID=A0ABT3FNZ9_9BACT|nr:DUF4328 domain-containing protein [Luteolibacter flavescens]MCW1885273.1 DUF4328 domain-containing protein [Luteolibacter flavescens]